ncbi:hypothetical protein GGX14DRAFT_310528, partial [Mycena pura]
KSKDAPRTTAKPKEKRRENLTLFDWLTVIEYVEEHSESNVSQKDVVEYFANRAEGVLHFTQGALSKKLKIKDELRARANANPSALSAKRPRIVTRPDVEQALWVWHQGAQDRNFTITGEVLIQKRKQIEDLLNIPEEQRLTGRG